MNILAIDTSSEIGSIALVRDNKAPVERRLHSLPGHSESLLLCIRSVLHEAGMEMRDIDLLAAGTGPGSFTGLRVGLSAMKGLHLSLKRPLLGVSSLLSLAMNCLRLEKIGEGRTVCAAIDARRGDVFAAVYSFESQGVNILVGERMIRPDVLCSGLQTTNSSSELQSKGGIICLGDAFIMGDGGKLPLVHSDAFMEIPESAELHYPSASNVAMLARNRFIAGERDNVSILEPRYVRPVDFRRA